MRSHDHGAEPEDRKVFMTALRAATNQAPSLNQTNTCVHPKKGEGGVEAIKEHTAKKQYLHTQLGHIKPDCANIRFSDLPYTAVNQHCLVSLRVT